MTLPGQGYESGLGFVQNYFGAPFALILISAVFLPIYRRLKVYTAYEFLGQRFDRKTRLLGAGLFLLQRGLGAGITIYAPAIVLSTVMGWRLDLTIIGSGLVVIIDGHDILHSNIADIPDGNPISIENLKVHFCEKGNGYLVNERKFLPEASEGSVVRKQVDVE